jgi:hypothetical protein
MMQRGEMSFALDGPRGDEDDDEEDDCPAMHDQLASPCSSVMTGGCRRHFR